MAEAPRGRAAGRHASLAVDSFRRGEPLSNSSGKLKPGFVKPVWQSESRSSTCNCGANGLCRPGNAVVIGGVERFDEILPGLIQFAFYEGELRKLEHEMEADWLTAEADIPFTHSVDRDAPLPARACRYHDSAGYAAPDAVRARACLQKPSPAMAGSARRLAGELAVQAEVVERLGHVDDRLEVFEDLYELANDRLSEFSYFAREFRLELWIVLLLLAELIVMIADLWVSSRSMGR